MSRQMTAGSEIWVSRYEGGIFGEIAGPRYQQVDEGTLGYLGKKQELKRRFSFLSLFGFACTVLASWEASLIYFQPSFNNGGPAGMAWGFPIVWLCSTSVYLCLAEMASIAPIAGGQYFWVSILAPPSYRRLLSYLTGWLTTLAWMAALATASFMIGTSMQGLVKLNHPEYVSKPWQGTLFAWCTIVVSVLINTLVIGLLPFLEGLLCIVHILGFAIVLIILLYLSPHVPASDVFFRSMNKGEWPVQGLSYLVGFIGNVNAFAGADAAVHMSEEIENAALNVPRAMFSSLLLNGALGYAMVLALMFCITDIEGAAATNTGPAYIQIFANGTGKGGATIMTVLTIALAWVATVGYLAAGSRMLWAFARDKGVPFHRAIRKVDKKSSIPILAIIIATVIPMLLELIQIGSQFVYTNVMSIAVSGVYLSYLFPCSLLLWRRVTGQIRPHNAEDLAPAELLVTTSDKSFSKVRERKIVRAAVGDIVDIPVKWGPWKIPGVLGTLNNILACTYCIFVLFWSFWPSMYPATPNTMNYAIVVIGAVFMFAVAYYFIHGKRNYHGPLIEFISSQEHGVIIREYRD